MDPSMQDSTRKVVKFVQGLLDDLADKSSIGPVLIAEQIELVLRMKPAWGDGLDRTAVTEELVRRFSMWIGKDGTLRSDVGHLAWLDAGRKNDWRLWQRYREFLELDLSGDAIEALDRSTDGVLGLLEDPQRDGEWDRRGLVVGHVQSGKTGNYTGVICKAADAGYKIIIVLAGLHNNLRSQTQIRLDEGFLGYTTVPTGTEPTVTGVGHIDSDKAIRPNYVTNRTDKGDFSTAIAKNLGISPEERPWLFVVKKNKTVLKHLLGWIRSHVADTTDAATGRKIVTKLPLLVIDDEADHASVDTGEQVFKEDGSPDEEHSPTAINALIRQILHAFARKAYVGYTATPFANIFIHERGRTRDEGEDLFPSAFIINLAAPSSYVGPTKVFGVATVDGRTDGLPLVRVVDDHQDAHSATGWMPQGHKITHQPASDEPDGMPSSLRRALLSFVLACAARTQRGQGHKHCSMLVHVTRYTRVQELVRDQVEEAIKSMRQRIQRRVGHLPLLEELRDLWNSDFVPATAAVQAALDDPGIRTAAWDDIAGLLDATLADIQVRTVNGTAKDALDYVDNAGRGLKVIAIGGDKLARGLTLEGLCISYFLRASRMYDTLMQMGRWFGYRPGYLDLCRLYTTGDLVDWFRHIADASEELREEFDLMQASGGTPRDYGLKVQSHPVLMVTSRVKMRTARSLQLSFSGQVVETVVFHRDPGILNANLKVMRGLVTRLGTPSAKDVGGKGGLTGYLWRNIPAQEVIEFLRAYRTHPDSHKVVSSVLAEFIDVMGRSQELTTWTVALLGGGDGDMIPIAADISVKMAKRTQRGGDASRYPIRRLLTPRDEAIDLAPAAWDAALRMTRELWQAKSDTSREQEPDLPSGQAIRRIRGLGAAGVDPRPDQGLLLLYIIDPKKAEAKPELSPAIEGVAAFGVSFPGSQSGVKVEYKVTNLYWEQEYGAAD